jgi:hypothetical protein
MYARFEGNSLSAEGRAAMYIAIIVVRKGVLSYGTETNMVRDGMSIGDVGGSGGI